jgi:hypothetical protein
MKRRSLQEYFWLFLQLVSKEAIGPLTPLLTAPLGITTTPSSYFTASNIPAEMTPYPSTGLFHVVIFFYFLII